MDLELNNLQRLICHKIQTTNQNENYLISFITKLYSIETLIEIYWGSARGVMVKTMDCGIVVSEFELQSRYYVHFRANTLGNGMNPRILLAMG